MPNSSLLSRLLAVVFVFALLLAIAGAGISQSGRRAKPKTAPVPTPEPVATPATATPAEKPKAQITFIVGMDRFGDGAISLYTYRSVLRYCVDRLNDGASIKAVTAKQEMSRSDAIKLAKADRESNVVYLQLRPDTLTDTRGTSTVTTFYLQYTVFAPTTAKIVASGQTYPQAYRARGVIVRPNSSGNSDYELNQAAREAAERILKVVNVPAPRYR